MFKFLSLTCWLSHWCLGRTAFKYRSIVEVGCAHVRTYCDTAQQNGGDRHVTRPSHRIIYQFLTLYTVTHTFSEVSLSAQSLECRINIYYRKYILI